MKKQTQIFLFLLSICIHIFFYISSYFTHTLDIFFEKITIGQDFFQIPNGAYAFLHGGTLTGALPPNIQAFTTCCGVNSNVYHPFFTLLVGIPLQFFSPWTAFGIWSSMHLLTTIILVAFLWSKFKNHRYIYLALALFLINPYHYPEIQHAQYHFLLNFFTAFFLYESFKNGDTKIAGVWLFLSLLVKPVALLWILPLLFYKRIKTILVGASLYALATLPFIFSPIGHYYLQNFLYISQLSFPTYNLYSIVHVLPSFPARSIKIVSYIIFGALLLFQILKRPNLPSIIILWVGYQLLFYSYVFQYHYSIVACILCLGVLIHAFTINKKTIAPIILLSIPTPTIFFHLAGFPPALPPREYSIIALYSACCLIWLMLAVVYGKNEKKIIV